MEELRNLYAPKKKATDAGVGPSPSASVERHAEIALFKITQAMKGGFNSVKLGFVDSNVEEALINNGFSVDKIRYSGFVSHVRQEGPKPKRYEYKVSW